MSALKEEIEAIKRGNVRYFQAEIGFLEAHSFLFVIPNGAGRLTFILLTLFGYQHVHRVNVCLHVGKC